MKTRKLLKIGFFLCVILLSNCKKDISVPDTEIEKIFGTWEWQGSHSGWGSPSLEDTGYDKNIEYKRNGIMKVYLNGKVEDKRMFSITEGNSIFNSETAYIISYSKCGLLSKNKLYVQESINFKGEDTLYLSVEAQDGSRSLYIRKNN